MQIVRIAGLCAVIEDLGKVKNRLVQTAEESRGALMESWGQTEASWGMNTPSFCSCPERFTGEKRAQSFIFKTFLNKTGFIFTSSCSSCELRRCRALLISPSSWTASTYWRGNVLYFIKPKERGGRKEKKLEGNKWKKTLEFGEVWTYKNPKLKHKETHALGGCCYLLVNAKYSGWLGQTDLMVRHMQNMQIRTYDLW